MKYTVVSNKQENPIFFFLSILHRQQKNFITKNLSSKALLRGKFKKKTWEATSEMTLHTSSANKNMLKSANREQSNKCQCIFAVKHLKEIYINSRRVRTENDSRHLSRSRQKGGVITLEKRRVGTFNQYGAC